MEYGEKFKKSFFGGFNRQDVLKCFEEVNDEHQKTVARFQRATEDLQKENDALKAKSEEHQKEADELKAQLEELKKTAAETAQSTAELEEKLNSALENNKRLSARAEELQREVASQKALNSKLVMRRDVLEANNKQLSAKLQEFNEKQTKEKASLEIGEIMMEAKNAADKIVARAHEKSNKLKEVTNQEANQAEKQFDQTREKLAATMDSFKNFSAEVIRDLEKLQNDLKNAKVHIHEEHVKAEPSKEEKVVDFAPKTAEEPKKGFKTDFLFRK